MIARTLTILAVLAAIGHGPLFAQQNEPAMVGDQIVIQLAEDLAAEYGKRTGAIKSDQASPGLQIETTATVAQQLHGDRIRVEHTSPIVRDGQPTRLVTLTATVKSTRLRTIVTPKGTAVVASPAEHKKGAKPIQTTTETKTRRLPLSDLEEVKLRTWTFAEELGG